MKLFHYNTMLLVIFVAYILALSEAFVYRPATSILHTIYNEGCKINIKSDTSTYQPLLLDPETDDFLYSTDDSFGFLEFQKGQQLNLFCSDGFSNPEAINASLIGAFCVKKTQFQIEDHDYDFKTISCNKYAKNEARRTDRPCANGEGTIVHIGFDIGSKFINFLDLCFNEYLEAPIYSRQNMSLLNTIQQPSKRTPFQSTGFYGGKNLYKIYDKKTVLATFTKILGSEELARKYLHFEKPLISLDKGHLTAFGDPIYTSQRRATFWFMNTAPQYNTFNQLNWNYVEQEVRKLFYNKKIQNGEVFTGTFGVLTLPDINDDQQPIFLYFDENNNGQIPVPEIYYKVLLDRDTKKGVAIIGLNNIFLTKDEVVDHIYCNDISDKISWMPKTYRNISLGYIYACSVEDWIFYIGKDLNDLDTSGGLLI